MQNKLLLDYQAFEMQTHGGVSRIYVEAAKHLEEYGTLCRIGIRESDNVHLRESGLVGRMHRQGRMHDAWFGRRKLFPGQRRLARSIMRLRGYGDDYRDANKVYCQRLLGRGEFDVFEPTFFDSYFLPYLKGKPFALTVHDMIPELFPQYFSADDFQIRQKRLLCPLAAAIHVPSQQTKEDLVGILNIEEEKVHVVPWGGGERRRERATEAMLPTERPYLLYVGERWGYKNFDLFLREMAIVHQKERGIEVVCTGSAFCEEEKRQMVQLGIGKMIRHIFADEATMQQLYSNAEAFVYPSAYEGFGLPIVEAMGSGCPTLLNSTAVFHEVGGEAAIYFDIEQRGDLAEHILHLLRLPAQERASIATSGRQRAALFSWKRTAESLSKMYNSIV